jgi:hypothetical protein
MSPHWTMGMIKESLSAKGKNDFGSLAAASKPGQF